MDREGADPRVLILGKRPEHLGGGLQAAIGLRIEQPDDLAAELWSPRESSLCHVPVEASR